MTEKTYAGKWTVYRRQTDERTWVEFHQLADRFRLPTSDLLAKAVAEYISTRREWLPGGEYNSMKPK